jgi:hypothetical protein
MKGSTMNLPTVRAIAFALIAAACVESDDSERAVAPEDGPWTPAGNVAATVPVRTGRRIEGYEEINLAGVYSMQWDAKGTLWALVLVRVQSVLPGSVAVEVPTFAKFEGGQWQKLAPIVDIQVTGADKVPVPGKLVIDKEGRPNVPYTKAVGNELSRIGVVRFSDGKVEEVGAQLEDTLNTPMANPQLFLGKDGRMHIAYERELQYPDSFTRPAELGIAIRAWDGTRWMNPILTDAPKVGNGTWEITADETGAPLIAQVDVGYTRVRVDRFADERWQMLGGPILGSRENITTPHIVARRGVIAVAFKTCTSVSLGSAFSGTGAECASTVAVLKDKSWDVLPFPSILAAGGPNEALSIDIDAQKRIVYAANETEQTIGGDVTGQGLRVRRYDGARWSRMGQPPKADPNLALQSVAVDDQGKVAVTYTTNARQPEAVPNVALWGGD